MDSGRLRGQVAGVDLRAGDDAGGFYCEHIFYVAQMCATRECGKSPDSGASSTVPPSVGFLHVPRDPACDDGVVVSQGQRHRVLRQAVGIAIKGLVDGAALAMDAPVHRLLLTGFEAWGDVKSNPSGDFVRHPENVAAALDAAGLLHADVQKYGADLSGQRLTTGAAVVGRMQGSRGEQWEVVGLVLPVDDGAIDGGPHSLQAAMAAWRPVVVLSLGVHRGQALVAETVATDAGLRPAGAGYRHESLAPATERLLENRRLLDCFDDVLRLA